ncbi:rhodoquinone methyltransferase, mitochondrial [Pelomyxa schiedti]|nr:rhodoquinone methyltransferase, mitochondrial [Pelomyxa schiedti]
MTTAIATDVGRLLGGRGISRWFLAPARAHLWDSRRRPSGRRCASDVVATKNEPAQTRTSEKSKEQQQRGHNDDHGQAVMLPGAKTVIDYYSWAYVWPRAVRFWNRDLCVATILWFWHKRLQREVRQEIPVGSKVLQASNVYGSYTQNMAKHIGPLGTFDVIDVMPIQVEQAKKKLQGLPQASARLADAANPGGNPPYDACISYFLLHEVTSKQKREIVNALLNHVKKDGGKVVFIDYHRMAMLHPLRPVMHLVWALLEPFARNLTRFNVWDYAEKPYSFTWTKKTMFWGLYQKTVATAIVPKYDEP